MDDLEDLFENAPCGYLLTRSDGRILRVNGTLARWLGKLPNEIVGQRFPDLLNIAGKIYYETHFAPLLRMQGAFHEVALDLARADGPPMPALINAVERRDEEGGLPLIRMTVFNASDRRRYEQELLQARRAAEKVSVELRDLNADLERRVSEATAERMQAEETLRQSQKMEAIGQLTGGVAHDFNNLLTVIRGSVDLLRRSDLPEAKRARYVDAIGDTADRAAKLTGQLLAFARRQALSADLFDAGASLEEVATMLQTMTGSRTKLEVHVPAEPYFVLADRSQFDTAIVNMGINGRDAMGGEGRLTITTGPVSGIPPIRGHAAVAGDYIAVTISDTGAGIMPDQLTRIFEPFFTTKEVGAGTGLGLSQVIGFAKQSGGDVRVDSVLGEGTTFTLYLPRAYPDPTLQPDEDNVDGHHIAEGTCVLVVEDNEQVGRFATAALVELGYECRLATNAKQALATLSSDASAFHIVFSDVVMPGMGGVELGQEIRRLHPDVPIILTSGYSHVLAENGRHGFELLHKPYSIDQLSRVLRKAVTWQRARQSPLT